MNKVNPFLSLIAPFLLIFLSNVSIVDEVALDANLDQTSLVKGTARSHSAFLSRLLIILPNVMPRNWAD